MGARTTLWGLREPNAQSPSDTRLVQYFDKARMEINNPNADRRNPWFVTNGLLPIELITGQLQVGEDQFEARSPADAAAIGDPDNAFPAYADLARVFTRQGAGDQLGNPVTGFFAPDGSISVYNDYRADPTPRLRPSKTSMAFPPGFWRT
jgi:hypothetical protein